MKTKLWLSFLTLIGIVLSTQTAQAQTYQPSNRIPVADSTLNTQVLSNGSTFDITGGLTKGQTLFHSFTDFSVPTNGAANFVNLTNPRDIISRVTGNSFSDINGLVNTNGANLFLINPNGIVFGTNARLNVGKAFVASTANGINLVDGAGSTITFGTNTNGDALLSIAPNVLFNVSSLIMGGGNGQISNFGTLQTNNPSQYIGLIGGNVNLNGGKIIAPGGRVELGSLSAPGTVTFGVQGDVSLTNGSSVDVTGAGGGDIAISARNLEILGGSVLRGGIEVGLGIPESVAGNIKVNAMGTIVVVGSNSNIENDVNLNSHGKGGNVTITAGSLSLRDGAQLSASTFGTGDAGNVTVKAKDAVSLVNSNIFSTIEAGGVGKGGGINIEAASLSLQDSAQLQTITRDTTATQPAGQGDAGSVTVNVSGAVDIAGSKDGFSTAIYSDLRTGSKGNGGNITITAGSLSLRDGAQLSASTFGRGDAGKITIDTTGKLSLNNYAAIYNLTDIKAVGDSKGIKISASEVDLKNISRIESNSFGKGNAGDISLNAKSVTLSNASRLIAFSNDLGKAGDLIIDTGNDGFITITDTVPGGKLLDGLPGGFSSGLFATVERYSFSVAGKISLRTGTLNIDNGGVISTRTRTNTAPIQPNNPKSSIVDGKYPAEPGAGSISIDAKNINITGGGQILTTSTGNAPAGDIILKNVNTKLIISGSDPSYEQRKASVAVAFPNGYTDETGNYNAQEVVAFTSNPSSQYSGIFANNTSISTGKGGSIILNPLSIKISDGGQISVSNQGTGEGGNIFLTSNIATLNNGEISAESKNATGGDIKISLGDYLLLRNDSSISTSSESSGQKGNGGNITIGSPLIIALPGNNDITANASAGNGGKVAIVSQGLFGIQNRAASPFTSDITSTSTFGQSGAVNISTPGTDPGRDSTELPNTTTDASNQISQVCSANNRQNKLTVAGRGGLPPNANDPLTSDVVWQDARATSSQPAISSTTTNPAKLPPPAVGWVFDGKGKVTLIAAVTQGQPTTGTRVVCPNVK